MTAVEPGVFGRRQAPTRPEIVSESGRPMLIFLLAAERRVEEPPASALHSSPRQR